MSNNYGGTYSNSKEFRDDVHQIGDLLLAADEPITLDQMLPHTTFPKSRGIRVMGFFGTNNFVRSVSPDYATKRYVLTESGRDFLENTASKEQAA